ncbi:hypothetical protein [Hymenobacter sp. DG01]|uniref:hypothetical protein n=1 Tax=Hymenobacter sp. DG01 TaxID=2584940 RepID=UPI00111ECE11|nr:hypothetical protein [Hymenobacter sp. DG01]
MTQFRTHVRVGLGAAVLSLAAFRAAPDDFVAHLIQQLTRYYAAIYPEKSYLHLDKEVYAAGETIWYKAYLVEGQSHQPDTMSRVLYVDLINFNRQVVAQQVLRLQRGTSPGDFLLPDTLQQGIYTLRAYTKWMRNAGPEFFFTRPVTVWSGTGAAANKRAAHRAATPQKGTHVQFFPEGGYLIAGLESTVGFKATDTYGHGTPVSGQIQDEQGNMVAIIKSHHLGMGRFQLTPAAGKRYTAQLRLSSGQSVVYPLPEAQPAGFTMRVLPLADGYKVIIQRRMPPGTPAERVTVVAQVRGQVAYAGQATINDQEAFAAFIPKNKFVGGVAHFTLFDGAQVARCERLAFVDSDPGLRLQVRPDKATYGPREKVTVHITASTPAGQPAAGQFSLAVNNAALVPADSGGTDIRTHLLLTSDLRGQVEQPGYYFRAAGSAAVAQALDDLLLTQGWRRFVWKQVLEGQLGERPYPLEQSISLSGRVVNSKVPVSAAAVTLFRFNPTQTLSATSTDASGRFAFAQFSGLDTARVVLQVKPTKGLRNPVIQPDQPWEGIGPEALLLAPLTTLPPMAAPYLASSRRNQAMERQYRLDARTIVLRNVTVQGKKVALTDPRRALYTRADAVVNTKDIPAASTYTNALLLLQGRVAGLTIAASLPSLDARSATLYWNPAATTGASGVATVTFYTSDEGGPFRLTLQGISLAGIAGCGSSSFQVVARQ